MSPGLVVRRRNCWFVIQKREHNVSGDQRAEVVISEDGNTYRPITAAPMPPPPNLFTIPRSEP
jgi:hypothetical protein